MASQQQLKKAYEMMKAGNRREAAGLLQGILKTDKTNVQAWWMLANALDREDLKIKSLEKVLALQPDHQRAQDMLERLRPSEPEPDDDFFAAPTSSLEEQPRKEKPKNDDIPYLKKDLPDLDDGETEISPVVMYAAGGVVLLFVILVLSGIVLMVMDSGASSPERTVNEFITAVTELNVDRMRELTCEADRGEYDNAAGSLGLAQGMTLEEVLAEEDITLDLSELTANVVSVEGDRATARLSGSIRLGMTGVEMTMDVDEMMQQAGGDTESTEIPLVREGGQWRICSPESLS